MKFTKKTLLIIFIVSSLVLAVSSAFAQTNDRNDSMCSAIFTLAATQITINNEHSKQQSKQFYSLGYMIAWKQDQMKVNPIDYGLKVDEYLANMDTATALLHWHRCEQRANSIWPEYQASIR